MNLITDKWLPVLRSDGSTERISLSQITSKLSTDPIIRLNFSRPDFNAFGTQFLIGFIQSTFLPKTVKDLEALLKKPPTKTEWIKAAKPTAFELDGKKRRFMQEKDTLIFDPEKNLTSIGYLLFEYPGKQTIKEGRDWFVRGNSMKCLCPSCAAMALYIRQINSYSAGPGYFTAFRSGDRGVVSTLLTGRTLWETILFNVMPKSELSGDFRKPLYPWMSDNLPMNITDEDVHPNHYFWEMPSRLYLNFSKMDGHCSICNEKISYGTSTLFVTNRGRKATNLTYSMSPYSLVEIKEKGTKEKKLTRKYQVCSETFSQFLKGMPLFVKEIPNILKHLCQYKNDKPADSVRLFYEKRSQHHAGLWIFGYNYEKSKYNGWLETTLSSLPKISPELTLITDISLHFSNILHYYVTRVLGINDFKPGKGQEKKYPEPMVQFFQNTEPLVLKAISTRDIDEFVDEMINKIISIFKEFTLGHILYHSGHKGMVTSINKILTEHSLKLIPEELSKPEYRKKKVNRMKGFSKELNVSILKWWGWLRHNNSAKNQLMGCSSIDEIAVSIAGKKLKKEVLQTYYEEILPNDAYKERMLKAAQLSIFIKEHDWDIRFLREVSASSDKRIQDLSNISDPVRDWAKIYQMISIIQRVNVPNFLETIASWNTKISTFSRKVSV